MKGKGKKKKSLANNMFFPSFLHNDPRDLMKPVSSETDVKIPKKILLSRGPWVNGVISNFSDSRDLEQTQDLKFTPAFCGRGPEQPGPRPGEAATQTSYVISPPQPCFVSRLK